MRDQQKTADIQITELIPYAEYPFKLYVGRKLDALVNSIKESGVLAPIIVRPKGGKYEILSGHNRTEAARLAGLTSIPAIIRKRLTDDDARLIVTITNLIQRSFSDLSHSERAAALTEHYNAVKNQGRRTDLLKSLDGLLGECETSVPMGHRLKARELVAKTYGLGGTVVARYLRVTYLTDALKERLDNGEFSLRAAVQLSYLSPDSQYGINSVLDDYDKPSIYIRTACELRAAETNGILDINEAKRIIETEKDDARHHNRAVLINSNYLLSYFTPEHSDIYITKTIVKALDAWFAKSVS